MDRIRHPIHALWRTAHPGGVLDGDAVCAVCGGRSAGRYASARIMADTFTRYDVFRRPEAPTVCDACAWYLDGSGKQTGEPHPPFQKMSYAILPARYVSLDRQRIGPPANVRALRWSSMSWLRIGWPGYYDEVCRRYPHLRSFA